MLACSLYSFTNPSSLHATAVLCCRHLLDAHFYPTFLSRTIPHFQLSKNYFVAENVFREVHFVSKER